MVPDQETLLQPRNAQLKYTHIMYCTLWEKCKQTRQKLKGKDKSSDVILQSNKK